MNALLPNPNGSTRILPAALGARREIGWEQRLALFCHGLCREGAADLVAGLSQKSAEAAATYLQFISKLSSAERQGRVAAAFGLRDESGANLRTLWAEASPALRRELFQQLPPYQRSSLRADPPRQGLEAVQSTSSIRALAARLIREASL